MAVRAGCQPGCGGGGGGAGGSCEEILEGCIAPNLDAPLTYDPDTGTIGLCVSSQADSSLYIDANGCLADVAGGTTPSPPRRTIATLPTGFFGAHYCGAADHPYGSPQGAENAIAAGIEWIDSYSLASSDGVAIWAPYQRPTTIDVWTTSPGTVPVDQVPSSALVGLLSDAGNPYQPISQRGPAPDNAEPTGRDVNWWGFSAGTWQIETTATMLERIAGRAVVCLRCFDAADVPANIRAIGAAQAADWAMIMVPWSSIASVSQITGAGLVACVNLDTDTTTTPATVVASGATWCAIRWDQDDARITALVAAGLNVVVITDSTHYETNRADTLGAKGITTISPIYARGARGTTEALRYRTGTISWRSKGMHPGTLTKFTETFTIVNGRGYTSNAFAGRCSETRYQWTNDRTTPQAFVSTLLGELNPVPTPGAYTINWTLTVRQRPGGPFAKCGVFFGFSSDKALAVPDSSVAVPGKNGYVAFIRPSNGSVVIGKLTNGQYTQLATTAGTAPPLNTALQMQLVVTATNLTFRRVGGATVTVADGDYRGPYVFEQKEEDAGSLFECITDAWVQT